jgi:hypothetical protein
MINIFPHVELCPICGQPFIVDKEGCYVCQNDQCEVWDARQKNGPYKGAWKVSAEPENNEKDS